MNRRTFVRTLTAAALAGPAFPLLPSPAKNWLWIHPGTPRSDDDWKRLFAQVRAAGIDAVLPEVFDGREVLFGHPTLPVREALLERLLPLTRSEGLELHAWMWTLNINHPLMVQRHPGWYAVNGRGEPAHSHPAYVDHYKFLCPRRGEVREWVRENVRTLAAIDELDGIHLDYVRMPDVILARGLWSKYGIVQDREYPQYDYCYCPECRRGFRSRTGIDPLTDLRDPAADAAWRQYRYDAVTGLVNDRLVPAARERGKAITAAVFPNWRYVRQEWHRWQLDGFLPMLYHSFYEEDIAWIGRQTREGVERLQGRCPLYAGLFVPALSPAELTQAIAAATANGAAGVSLFSHRALRDEHWRTLKN